MSLGRRYFLCTRNSLNNIRCYCVRLDESGEVVQIHFSTRFRDSFCRQSLEDVEPLYQALRKFSTLLYDPQNLVEMQLKTGKNSTYSPLSVKCSLCRAFVPFTVMSQIFIMARREYACKAIIFCRGFFFLRTFFSEVTAQSTTILSDMRQI